ncbi:MAG: hypothetical protein B6D46_06650 [Polyangiaceae bacterium UTPRO1]|nr:MAG: hypothetical protein B6D46_06650 [Polyangiaceae bacterium UTPRO1]
MAPATPVGAPLHVHVPHDRGWFSLQACSRLYPLYATFSVAMSAEKTATAKILQVLRPYASNWTGTLGRGDLVIPQREIPRVIHQILDAVHELTETHREAPEGEIFQALMESRRLPSVQDQLTELRKRFLIMSR